MNITLGLYQIYEVNKEQKNAFTGISQPHLKKHLTIKEKYDRADN